MDTLSAQKNCTQQIPLFSTQTYTSPEKPSQPRPPGAMLPSIGPTTFSIQVAFPTVMWQKSNTLIFPQEYEFPAEHGLSDSLHHSSL
jgi:hypothetical protein